MNRIETLQEHYERLKKYEMTDVYNPSLAHAAADALAWGDYTAGLLDNSPKAMYGRYEFRDGAANLLATIFGLDMDYARRIMQTHEAWDDYQETLKETTGSYEYEIRKVISDWKTEHSGWVFAPNDEKALEIARDFQGDNVIVRRHR